MASKTSKTGGDTPFSEAMQQAQSAAEDFARMFADIKLPAAPDMEALLAAHKRNMDTLTSANRIALEGAQAVAKRQMEIMQQTMAELGETMREAAQAKGVNPAELLKHAYEQAVANISELSEMIRHSNGEALELLNKRFAEATEEMKVLTQKAAPHKP